MIEYSSAMMSGGQLLPIVNVKALTQGEEEAVPIEQNRMFQKQHRILSYSVFASSTSSHIEHCSAMMSRRFCFCKPLEVRREDILFQNQDSMFQEILRQNYTGPADAAGQCHDARQPTSAHGEHSSAMKFSQLISFNRI